VQLALSPLHLAQVLVSPRDIGGRSARQPLADNRRQRLFRLREPASHQLSSGQVPAGDGFQQPFAPVELSQGPAAEHDRALSIPTELGQGGASERYCGGQVPQQACALAHRRLEWLLVSIREGTACGIEQVLDGLRPAAEESQRRLREQQPRPRAGHLGRERRQPPHHGRPLAPQVDELVGVLLDQPRCPEGVSCAQCVAYRVVGEPVPLMPGGRVTVQRHCPPGPFLLQARAEQVGEQVVIAPPTAHLIQRYQEQVRPLHSLQHRLAAGPAGDRITQPAGQPFQHRGFQQEGAYLLTLAFEHLLGQVVQDVTVTAAERRHEPGGIRPPPQRQGGQLQAGRPPLGAGRQRRHRRSGQVAAHRPAQQRCRLLRAEAQVGGAHFR
jgi:hypothetical protein